jgi:SAM-dependent methyltransferase
MLARTAYDAFARAYDDYTADYAYDRWLGAVAEIAGELGMRGRDALDAACGTGNSSLPLVEQGFDVTACDLSPAMVAAARQKLPDPRHVGVADMRALPFSERFDLATCLDDGINYLTGAADLNLAMDRLAAALRPGGMLAFDGNTLGTLRAAYSGDETLELGDWRYRWQGHTPPDLAPGAVAASTLTISRRRRVRRGWAWCPESVALHRQAHHGEERIRDALAAAGMDVVAVFGQSPGVVLSGHLDEHTHTKALYFARRRRRRPPRPRPRSDRRLPFDHRKGGAQRAHPPVG